MFKKIYFWGLTSGILASVAAIILNRIYLFATSADFSRLINVYSIVSFNLLVCVTFSILYWFLKKWLKNRAEIIFNFIFAIISFAGIIIPVSVKLPLDMQNPELFPGLTIPMLFFPALAWFTLRPLFNTEAIAATEGENQKIYKINLK